MAWFPLVAQDRLFQLTLGFHYMSKIADSECLFLTLEKECIEFFPPKIRQLGEVERFSPWQRGFAVLV